MAFLDNAISRRTVHPLFVVARAATVLVDLEFMDKGLWALLEAMQWFFVHPGIKRARGMTKDLAMAILFAAQRQVCSGEDEWVYRILQLTFSHIGCVIPCDMHPSER